MKLLALWHAVAADWQHQLCCIPMCCGSCVHRERCSVGAIQIQLNTEFNLDSIWVQSGFNLDSIWILE
jgi:hypothetical protein